MIVDTSIWIDGLRGTQTWQVIMVTDYIKAYKQTKQLYITPTILQEVLQGIRQNDRYDTIKAGMLAHALLKLDPVEAAIGAAQLYRDLRKKGVTIRKPNDCLIAYHAIFYDMPILHNDVDFDQIARFTALRIAPE